MLHEIVDAIGDVVLGAKRSGRPLTKKESKRDVIGLWILGAIIVVAGVVRVIWRHW